MWASDDSDDSSTITMAPYVIMMELLFDENLGYFMQFSLIGTESQILKLTSESSSESEVTSITDASVKVEERASIVTILKGNASCFKVPLRNIKEVIANHEGSVQHSLIALLSLSHSLTHTCTRLGVSGALVVMGGELDELNVIKDKSSLNWNCGSKSRLSFICMSAGHATTWGKALKERRPEINLSDHFSLIRHRVDVQTCKKSFIHSLSTLPLSDLKNIALKLTGHLSVCQSVLSDKTPNEKRMVEHLSNLYSDLLRNVSAPIPSDVSDLSENESGEKCTDITAGASYRFLLVDGFVIAKITLGTDRPPDGGVRSATSATSQFLSFYVRLDAANRLIDFHDKGPKSPPLFTITILAAVVTIQPSFLNDAFEIDIEKGLLLPQESQGSSRGVSVKFKFETAEDFVSWYVAFATLISSAAGNSSSQASVSSGTET